MDVVPVVNPNDLTRFIRFPHQVYRDNPNWVAPLDSDEKTRLTPGKNPYFEHAEAAYFLARENGRDVGRIAATVDRNYDATHGERQTAFGFLEAESAKAVEALIRAAERWGRERGAQVMRGPMNFTTNDDCGLLIQGFDEPPMILMPYNPPTYAAWLESAGMRKAKDLYAFRVPVPPTPEEGMPQITRVGKLAAKRHGVKIRPIEMKKFDEELGRVKEIYNSAWEKNWGFVPMTEHEIDHMAAQLKPAVVPDLALFAEIEGKTAGVMLAVPDVNVALRPLRGKLFPFGIARLLWTLPRIRTFRVMALGVKADFRKRGVEAALIHYACLFTARRGYHSCEVGWTLEDNDLVNSVIEASGGTHTKTYRIYERNL